ncbi:hypothetical protein ACFYQA_01385 [Streptomyces sp. NPDC005774]
MRLMILTDDRMYELRVDMPKGTPGERGATVFKGARDRLEIEADRSSTP